MESDPGEKRQPGQCDCRLQLLRTVQPNAQLFQRTDNMADLPVHCQHQQSDSYKSRPDAVPTLSQRQCHFNDALLFGRSDFRFSDLRREGKLHIRSGSSTHLQYYHASSITTVSLPITLATSGPEYNTNHSTNDSFPNHKLPLCRVRLFLTIMHPHSIRHEDPASRGRHPFRA